MTFLRSVTRAAVVAGGFCAAVALPALAVAAPVPVPPAMLNTTCSLDQIMAATKVVDPLVAGAIIDKYNSEPAWVQGGVIYHMNLFLQKTPQQRQTEITELERFFPEYSGLFRTAEPTANAVAAQCATFPAVDPSVWNASAPAPAPVAAPLPAAPQPATAAAPGAPAA
jgi:hypothetical protein